MPPAKKVPPEDGDEGVSPSEQPLEVGRAESGREEAKPRLHVFVQRNANEEVVGWRWRFELGGATVKIDGQTAQSRADEPFASRLNAIEHGDRWGTREFGEGGFEGGARVMIPE